MTHMTSKIKHKSMWAILVSKDVSGPQELHPLIRFGLRNWYKITFSRGKPVFLIQKDDVYWNTPFLICYSYKRHQTVNARSHSFLQLFYFINIIFIIKISLLIDMKMCLQKALCRRNLVFLIQ